MKLFWDVVFIASVLCTGAFLALLCIKAYMIGGVIAAFASFFIGFLALSIISGATAYTLRNP